MSDTNNPLKDMPSDSELKKMATDEDEGKC